MKVSLKVYFTLSEIVDLYFRRGVLPNLPNPPCVRACDPLVQIKLSHVVPDELHLMLQVTDVLTQNLIKQAAIAFDWEATDLK